MTTAPRVLHYVVRAPGAMNPVRDRFGMNGRMTAPVGLLAAKAAKFSEVGGHELIGPWSFQYNETMLDTSLALIDYNLPDGAVLDLVTV